mgnify:CR=1 FL=1
MRFARCLFVRVFFRTKRLFLSYAITEAAGRKRRYGCCKLMHGWSNAKAWKVESRGMIGHRLGMAGRKLKAG